MKLETMSFRTFYKPFMECLAKKDSVTLTIFINESIRKELEKRVDYLADVEARKITASELKIPGIAELSLGEIETFMSSERWIEFRKKWADHHTEIRKQLAHALSESPTYEAGKSDEIEFPIVID